MSEIKTCPKCGALVVPQLKRCRQCKSYLHGTALEGTLSGMIPEHFSHSPATFILMALILFYYAVCVVLAGISSAPGFSSVTLIQLGAVHGPSVLLGEYWRFITANFIHHDLLYLAFNLWALYYSGMIVEKLFDSKKMLLVYIAAGVLSMVISFFYYVYLQGENQVLVVTGGASGAVSGLIGAGLVGAHRRGPIAIDLRNALIRWSLFLVLWGFMMPNINNAAHFGGFAAGAGLASIVPLGLTQTPKNQKILSVVSLVAGFFLLFSFGLMLKNLYGYPASLEKDATPRSILGFVYHKGHEIEHSSQNFIWQNCVNHIKKQELTDEAVENCELNRRVNYHDRRSYEILAIILEAKDNQKEADRLRYVMNVIPE